MSQYNRDEALHPQHGVSSNKFSAKEPTCTPKYSKPPADKHSSALVYTCQITTLQTALGPLTTTLAKSLSGTVGF